MAVDGYPPENKLRQMLLNFGDPFETCDLKMQRPYIIKKKNKFSVKFMRII